MAYRKVDGKFWTDPKVRELAEIDKLIFMYFITNPRAHYSGIYYNPLPMMEFETGIAKERLKKSIDVLTSRQMVFYSEVSGFCFVKNLLKFQGLNGNEFKGVFPHLKEIQDKELIALFIGVYPQFQNACPDIEPKNAEGFVLEPKPEKEKAVKELKYSEEFENFWKNYDRPEGKGGKPDAFREWKNLTEESRIDAVKMFPVYQSSVRESKYLVHAERYLKKQVWLSFDESEKKDKYDRQIEMLNNMEVEE